MPHECDNPSGASQACLGDEPPDLRPLRALAEREEVADAARRLTDGFGWPMRACDPLAPLARAVAASLTEAGFTLHHCVQHHPLHRLGGVCLLPVACGHDPGGREGIVASWTTHDLLLRDWHRQSEYDGVHEVMNEALGEVLDVLGYQAWPFGQGCAWIVTGHRLGGQEAQR